MDLLCPLIARDLADRLDAIAEDDFVTWHGGERPDGVIQLPHPIYHSVEGEWIEAIKGFGIAPPSEAYGRILQGKLPAISLSTIASADLEILFGYATFIWRGERFCDGHIQRCHKQGYLSAVLRRYADLAEARR